MIRIKMPQTKSWRFILTGYCMLLLHACENGKAREEYRWVATGSVPSVAGEDIRRGAYWGEVYYISKPTANTFEVYGNYDSIRMHSPAADDSEGRLFKKVSIADSVWKAPAHYDSLFWVGNYIAGDLPGFYMSYYFSKGRRVVLQVHYTDPGKMNGMVLFSKDSLYRLQETLHL